MKDKILNDYLLTAAYDEACKVLNFEHIELSKRLKRKTNRIFREELGITEPKYPEVDNKFESMRSKLIIKFKRR